MLLTFPFAQVLAWRVQLRSHSKKPAIAHTADVFFWAGAGLARLRQEILASSAAKEASFTQISVFSIMTALMWMVRCACLAREGYDKYVI